MPSRAGFLARGGAAAAGAAAQAAGGGAPARVIPPHTVPPVVRISGIADAVARNHAINQSYHQFSKEMAKYHGTPLVSNWCTYGQHASREAGQQIRNLQAGLAILRDAQRTLVNFPGPHNVIALTRTMQRVHPTIRRIIGLLNEPGLMQQSLQLALTKAGVTKKDLNDVDKAIDEVLTPEWSDLIPFQQAREVVDVGVSGGKVVAKLIIGIPAIIRAVNKVYNNMVKGNKEIYENIAPAYNKFLQAALTAPNGVPDVSKMIFVRDPNGFLKAAFTKYAEARQISNQIGPGGNPALVARRNALMHEANLLVGYQEQLVILQPIFDTMQQELGSMNGTMVLRDPNGTHTLTNNWGNFYTRMGINPTTAPRNPAGLRPANLPPLQRSSSPAYKGTIAEYFEKYLTNTKIHNAPPAIRPL